MSGSITNTNCGYNDKNYWNLAFQPVNDVKPIALTQYQVGTAIPKDAKGNIKYLSSMTPLQVRKAVSICLSVIGVLSFIGTIIGCVFAPLAAIGIAEAVAMIEVSGKLLNAAYSWEIDFDSPKQRRKETEAIRAHKLSLSKINQRYGNVHKVVRYQLLGDSPLSIYEKVAHLAMQRAKADSLYAEEYKKIMSAPSRDFTHGKLPALDQLKDAYDAKVKPLEDEFNALSFTGEIQATDKNNPIAN